jgi:hypothetical protein
MLKTMYIGNLPNAPKKSEAMSTGHPVYQDSGPEKNNRKKMECRGGGEAQGFSDLPKKLT